MEKISNIVRGNSRVASTDLKSSGAVRPGALSFGRPIGESPQGAESRLSTAEKAVSLQNDLVEARKAHTQDRMVADIADSFFMTRIRRPEDQVAAPAAPSKAKISTARAEAEDAIDELSGGQQEAVEIGQPQGFVPRGSYVNVRA